MQRSESAGRQLRSSLCHGSKLNMIGVLALFMCSLEAFPQEHVVFVPLILTTDTVLGSKSERASAKAPPEKLQTTACLQVSERLYPEGRWWTVPHSQHSPQERAFATLMLALSQKDRSALLGLLDQNDAHGISKQKPGSDELGLAFQQFQSFDLVAVLRAYEFDDMAVFLATINIGHKVSYLPFVFARQEDGSFGFLLHWENRATYQIFIDWMAVAWGPTATAATTPNYCGMDTIKRANYRAPLQQMATKPVWHLSELLLSGFPVNAPGDHAAIAKEILGTMEKMKAAMVTQNLDEFARYMTPQGGESLKKGLVSTDQAARDAFKTAIGDLTAFFIFDAGRVLVVYNEPLSAYYGVMYFTRRSDGQLVWTNASHITPEDDVFKRGALYKAASLPVPFSSLAIK